MSLFIALHVSRYQTGQHTPKRPIVVGQKNLRCWLVRRLQLCCSLFGREISQPRAGKTSLYRDFGLERVLIHVRAPNVTHQGEAPKSTLTCLRTAETYRYPTSRHLARHAERVCSRYSYAPAFRRGCFTSSVESTQQDAVQGILFEPVYGNCVCSVLCYSE
jgi:hypothetical protein